VIAEGDDEEDERWAMWRTIRDPIGLESSNYAVQCINTYDIWVYVTITRGGV